MGRSIGELPYRHIGCSLFDWWSFEKVCAYDCRGVPWVLDEFVRSRLCL